MNNKVRADEIIGPRLLWCAALLALIAVISLPPRSAGEDRCSVSSTRYLGWRAEEMRNDWVKLEIVPEIGGRLMQVTFGGHNYLFVNPKLQGHVIQPGSTGHHWNNYGGDKIWPMPEGSNDERHWAGAGGEPLDDAPFSVTVLSQGKECKVRLTGPIDPQIGQQYTRDISITDSSPAISFHAVMKNVSGYPQTWSEQSVSQYNAESATDPSQYNPKFWAFVAVNPASAYLDGYHVRDGEAGNPGYTVQNGLFRLHWDDIEGEVWTDTQGGWAAVVDGTSQYSMIERIGYQPKAHYPGKSTILFYTTGRRLRNPNTPSQPPSPPIYYMEAELNSPMVTLYPGQSYAMDTQWYPTRMGSDFKQTTWSGVVGQPLTASASRNGILLAGEFGVFYPGTLVVHYYSLGGEALGTTKLETVSPLHLVDLKQIVHAPSQTGRVSLHVVDQQGVDRGPLGEVFVQPPPLASDSSQW